MERLSGMDASFVYLETPALHMHVSMLGVYDTSTVPGGYSFADVKSTITERLHLVPPFTQRLVEVPFKLHHPVWVTDPHCDIDHHVRRIAVPAPRGRREPAGTVLRLGRMGYPSTARDVLVLLFALGTVLLAHGGGLDKGAGVAAAVRYYDEN